jgi:hypothetical protein
VKTVKTTNTVILAWITPVACGVNKQPNVPARNLEPAMEVQLLSLVQTTAMLSTLVTLVMLNLDVDGAVLVTVWMLIKKIVEDCTCMLVILNLFLLFTVVLMLVLLLEECFWLLDSLSLECLLSLFTDGRLEAEFFTLSSNKIMEKSIFNENLWHSLCGEKGHVKKE